MNVRELFEELVDLDPTTRAQRLRDWALDRTTLVELQALLTGDANKLPLLEDPPGDVAALWRNDDSVIASLIGREVGSFRICELLGQGGSSVVFRAERVTAGACQVVALKLLRTGLFAPEAQRRFAREHAILAQLTHPNIARLIEGGVGETGIPYIAMELVDGAPITAWADSRALPLRERIALMLTLCRAVEAAHATLVVHRDLKPSNVYVDDAGEVKVLDFGTARLLDDEAGFTRTEAIMLTRGYAAPEQFRSGPVTTAADVYALGVLLGELLTGHLLDARTAARASNAVSHAGVERTPRGLPQGKPLARLLRGDLDAIIATTLAEEPGRRYRSAGALADDLERYLAGRAVQAHPPSRWYVAHKFARRHRHAVATTTLLVLALLAALGSALWQAGVARRAAAVAAAESARASALRDFMFDAFARAEPGSPKAAEATVSDVVERALAGVTTDRDADPRARIELQIRLAEVLGARGNLDRADAVLATVRSEAATALQATDPLAIDLEHALVYNLVERGKYAEARARCDRLLAILPPDATDAWIAAYTESATIATRQRDFARATGDALEALRRARAHGQATLLDRALRARGSALLEADRGAEAVPVFEEILHRKRARFGDVHVDVSAAEDGLARAYRRAGDLVRAEQHARAAIAIDAQAMPPDHPHRALHLNALVMVLGQRRAFDQGIDLLHEIIRIQRASEGDPDNLAANYGMLGQFQASLGNIASALVSTRLALAAIGRGSGEASRLGIRIRMNLGLILAMRGERAQAEIELDRALADLRAAPQPDAELIATALERKLRVMLDAGDAPAARASFDEFAAAAQALRTLPLWPGRVTTLHAELLLAEGHMQPARQALDAAAVELAASERVDPVVETAHALLRALAAPGASASAESTIMREQAHERFSALPYPPLYVQRLAAAAGLR